MTPPKIPRSLVAAFNEATAKGYYTGGNLEGFVAVRYLLFRTEWQGPREPPSKRAWIQHMLDYERQVDEAAQKKQDE